MRFESQTAAMNNRNVICACVSSETKESFRTLAQRQELTESALLKRLVWSAMRSAGDPAAQSLRVPSRRLRGARVCLRLHPDDLSRLTRRAAAQHMPAATYVSVVIRNHLRDLPPAN